MGDLTGKAEQRWVGSVIREDTHVADTTHGKPGAEFDGIVSISGVT
jgi:hypothetical protein